jgi:hypothetical protein
MWVTARGPPELTSHQPRDSSQPLYCGGRKPHSRAQVWRRPRGYRLAFDLVTRRFFFLIQIFFNSNRDNKSPLQERKKRVGAKNKSHAADWQNGILKNTFCS